MKKPGRKIALSSETLRVLDPGDLEKVAGDSLVTTTTHLPGCTPTLITC